jgi:hypothetical protein
MFSRTYWWFKSSGMLGVGGGSDDPILLECWVFKEILAN